MNQHGALIPRDDERLVRVVEELGEEANGHCAELKIVEIPDDVAWEIEKTDEIRVRGLGLADRNSHDNSRIVIVLEEVDLRQECCEPERQVIGASKEKRVAAILGSAQPGSDRGVFDV